MMNAMEVMEAEEKQTKELFSNGKDNKNFHNTNDMSNLIIVSVIIIVYNR